MMIAEVTAEDLEKLDGQAFAVTSVEPAQQLRLIEVLRKGKGERTGGSLSVLWHSDIVAVLPQDSYVMASDELGEVEIFIVPVGQISESLLPKCLSTHTISRHPV